MNDFIVIVRDLRVEFSDEVKTTTAVSDVSFDVVRGRTTAIVGESGSGKTVTAYTLLNLITPPGRVVSGSLHFTPASDAPFDIATLNDKDDELYKLRGGYASMIFQEPMSALSPVHTIGDQIMEALLIHQPVSKQEAEQQTLQMLTEVGLVPAPDRLHQYPFELSGGMRQRAVIAMAMICKPELLICDEPTTALDVTVQAEILTLIRQLKQQTGTSVIFITHDLGVVAQIADEVIVMYRGKILETGSVREILREPLHPYTRKLIAASQGLVMSDGSDGFDINQPLIHLSDSRSVALPADIIARELP